MYKLLVLALLALMACAEDHGKANVNEPAPERTEAPAQAPAEPSPAPSPAPSPTPSPAPSTDQATDPSEAPVPAADPMESPDECKTAGGTFTASTGGNVECEPGKTKLGNVRFGLEGGICCR